MKVRRDKWGRFAPKRHSVKLKPYTPPLRDIKGRFASTRKKRHRWKMLQDGRPIEVRPYGYFIVVHALVPGGWTTESTPTFIAEAPEESVHQIIWSTPVRRNLFHVTESSLLRDLRDEANSLAMGELAIGKAYDQDVIILSMDLRILSEPHVSHLVDSWVGITPPKWLRNVK